MPHDRLESFTVRSDVSRVDCRNDDADVGDFGCVAAIPADDAQNFRADGFCILQGSHQIGADIFFEVATADGEHEYEIVRAQAAHAKPSLEHSCPTFII